jgi:hypothetical protein
MVISINKDNEEVGVSELPAIFNKLRIHEFARKHPEIKVVMGFPEFLYKLPMQELAIYHFTDFEIRLLEVEKFSVTKSYVYEDGSLEEFLENKEDGLFPESSAPKFPEFAENLSPADYYNKVIKGDECWFVMNCSKDCPACGHQMPFF